MTAIVEMSTVPQWKHELLGRKAHSDERFDRMQSNVPEWKREILLRKNKILDTIYTSEKFSSSNGSHSSSGSPPRTSMRSSTGLDVFPYDEQDFDSLNSSQRVIADHLESVHDNPFFRAQGKILSHREGRENESLNYAANGNSVEEEEEYSPFSGIVNKLCKKFSNLGATEAPLRTASKPKRSASLENLLDTHHCHRHDVRFYSNSSQNDESEVKNTKEPLSTRLSGGSTGSSECLHHMSALYRQDGSQLRSRRSSDFEQKPYVAPDLGMGRKKIEIIDLPPLPKQRTNQTVVNEQTQAKLEAVGKNDLPKPNTVSNFRSMFESGYNKTESDRDLMRRRSPISSPPISNAWSQSDLFTTRPFTARNYNRVNEQPDSKLSDKSSFQFDKESEPPALTKNDKMDDDEEWTSTTEIRYVTRTWSPPGSPSFIDQKTSDSPLVNVSPQNGEINTIPDDADNMQMHIDRSIKPFHELKSNFETSVVKGNDEREKYHKNRYKDKTSSYISSSDRYKQINAVVSNSAQLQNEKMTSDTNIETSTEETMEQESEKTRTDTDYIPSSISDKKLLFDSHSIKSNITKPPPPSRTKKMDTSKKRPMVPKPLFEDESDKDLNLKSTVEPSAKLSTKNSPKSVEIENSKLSTGSEKVDTSTNSTPTFLIPDSTKNLAASPDVPRNKVFDSSIIKPPPVPSRRLPSKKNIVMNGSVEPAQDNVFESQIQKDSTLSITVEKQEPIKGIPSILAQRKNNSTKSGLYASTENSSRLENSVEDEGSDENTLVRPSDMKKKNVAGSLALSMTKGKSKSYVDDNKSDSHTTLLVLTDENPREPIPQSNIDDIIGVKKKEVRAKEIFSSDSIVPIVKKEPNRKAHKRPFDVPPLNLPMEQSEESPGYIPTKIKPCPYVFIGAHVLLPSKPLQKTKTKKVRT